LSIAGYAIEKEIERFQEKTQSTQKFFKIILDSFRTWNF